jgi:hypothetical protein
MKKVIKVIEMKIKGKKYLSVPDDTFGTEQKFVIYNQCQRCKNFSKQTNPALSNSFNSLMLCPHCLKSFKKWFNKGNDEI